MAGGGWEGLAGEGERCGRERARGEACGFKGRGEVDIINFIVGYKYAVPTGVRGLHLRR